MAVILTHLPILNRFYIFLKFNFNAVCPESLPKCGKRSPNYYMHMINNSKLVNGFAKKVQMGCYIKGRRLTALTLFEIYEKRGC